MNDMVRQLDALDVDARRNVLVAVADMRAQLVDRIAALPTATVDGVETVQSTSLRAFAADLDDAANRFAQRYGVDLANDMRAAGALSDTAHRDALTALARARGVPPTLIQLSPLGVSDTQIEAAVLLNTQAIANYGRNVAQTVQQQVQQVVFGLGSRDDAIKAIRAALKTEGRTVGNLTSRAEMITRVGIMSTFNIAAEHAYRQAAEELPDLEVEWIIAGSRVCPICTGLAGTRKKPGGTFPGGYLIPPAHPRCRCRVVASMPGWGKRPSRAQAPAPTPTASPVPQWQRLPVGKHHTIAQAEAWARNRYPDITFDFAGAHIDAINPTLAEFHRLAQKYPEAIQNLAYVGTYGGAGAPDHSAFDANTYAHATWGAPGKRNGRIGLNPVWYGQPAKFEQAITNDEAHRWHPQGVTGIRSIFTHEFGHIVSGWLRMGSSGVAVAPVVRTSGFGMVYDTYRIWLDSHRATTALSRYATTKKEEAFAEGFAALELQPKSLWTKWTKDQNALLNVVADTKLRSTTFKFQTELSSVGDERLAAYNDLRALARRIGVKVDRI